MVRSNIPARLDRLPWSRWHWRVVVALGIAWVLDGLEVTIVGSLGSVLERPDTLGLSAAQIGWAGSLYVAGAVVGALVFGRLADRLGRKRLFLVTLAVYMGATVATAFSTGFAFFALLPLPHRHRHRRRVRGHQLGHRRADPGARARPRQPGDQRQLLDRRGARRAAEPGAARPARARPACWAGAPASRSARCSRWRSCWCAAHVPESPRWLLRARPRRRGRARSCADRGRGARASIGGLAAGRCAARRRFTRARAARPGARSRTCCSRRYAAAQRRSRWP